MCMLILDDFFDDLKSAGSNLYQQAKSYVSENKELVHDVLSSIVRSLLPQAHPIFDAAWTAFGGQIHS